MVASTLIVLERSRSDWASRLEVYQPATPEPSASNDLLPGAQEKEGGSERDGRVAVIVESRTQPASEAQRRGSSRGEESGGKSGGGKGVHGGPQGLGGGRRSSAHATCSSRGREGGDGWMDGLGDRWDGGNGGREGGKECGRKNAVSE